MGAGLKTSSIENYAAVAAAAQIAQLNGRV
jgi:hypothetical protein